MSKSDKKGEEKTMRACVVEKFGGEIKVKNVPMPKAKPGQILIKMEAAPINPSDIAYIKGQYGIKNDPPIKIGLEGSGKVVANGGGLMGWYLLGKRVACITTTTTIGTWAEYVATMSMQAVPIADHVTYEMGASYFVNPLTAYAFGEYMEKGKHKACVQTAAASSVGKMIFRHLTSKGYDVINIVRREEQVQTMKELGAKYVLNSNDPNFEKELKELSAKLKATMFVDGVGGDLMWQVLKAMPAFTICYCVGHLSNKLTDKVDSSHLIFTNKQIRGYYLGIWIREKSLQDRIVMSSFFKKEISNILKTDVAKSFPLEKANEAVKFYTENMSLGKVLIKPSL